MGILIIKKDDEYWIESVSHSPIFSLNNSHIQSISYAMRIGKLKELNGFEVDKEYPDLDCYRDFDVVDRIPNVVHENGIVYDDLTFRLKPHILINHNL